VEIADPGMNYLQGELIATSAVGLGFHGAFSVNQNGGLRQLYSIVLFFLSVCF
jgi:hypothetical protein